MHSFLKDGERILKERHITYLRNLEKRYAVELTVTRQKQDTHSSVYGVESGRKSSQDSFTIHGIITADEFTPISGALSSRLTEAFLYTTSDQIRTGDQLQLEGDDDAVRSFKVTDKESIGSTISVFVRYKISALDAHTDEVRA